MNLLINNKKLILIAIFTIIIFLIAAIAIRLVLSAPSVSIQNEILSYPASYSASYPISYITANSDYELVPLNEGNLTKSVNTEQYCDDGQNGFKANLGIVTYRYSSGDFSTHDQNYKVLMINNLNKVTGENNSADFAEVIDYINNKKDLNSLTDLPAFNYACTGSGISSYIKSFNLDYSSMDNAIAYIYVGGTQYAWTNLTDVKFTIKVLAYKDNNVLQLSEYFEGAILFTEEQVLTCKTDSGYGYEYLSMDCIRDLYLQSQSAQDKVEEKSQELIKFFEFK